MGGDQGESLGFSLSVGRAVGRFEPGRDRLLFAYTGSSLADVEGGLTSGWLGWRWGGGGAGQRWVGGGFGMWNSGGLGQGIDKWGEGVKFGAHFGDRDN